MAVASTAVRQRGSAGNALLCGACPAYELNLCQMVRTLRANESRSEQAQLKSVEHIIPARRVICRERDLHDVIPILCEGWALSALVLSDGSRQILSFLLPGDIVSTALLFEPAAYCLVESVTQVRYRSFQRTDVKGILFKHPDFFEKLSKFWISEKVRADQLAADLGRRTAEERIARLILTLMDRLSQRGMLKGHSFEFPLRQHHIGDATGLTAVHVSKVMSEFRRKRLLEITDRSLTILDVDGFRRVAAMR